MDSNTYSIQRLGRPDGLAALAAAVDELATQELDGLADTVRAERVLQLRRLVDRLEGQWLKELAGVDGRGAAGADQDQELGSTAGWLRGRLRMGAGAAAGSVRTARALFRGPLTATAEALTSGEVSVAHAQVLASGTHDLPADTAAEAEPVLVEAARRLDPPRLRRVVAHLRLVADPDTAGALAERRHQQRGLWLAPTLEGMVALDGLLEPEAGQTLLAALAPLARPSGADDQRSASQRRADALAELARRNLESGRLPQAGGVRPQLTVTVDLDSLVGRQDTLGGDGAEGGPLHPEACRRLACDATLTRVLVTRHPMRHDPGADAGAVPQLLRGPLVRNPSESEGLAGRLRVALAKLPRSWVERPASRWRWGGPAGSSNPPSGPPWSSATAAVSSRAASDRRPGARPTIWSTGCTAAAPTWPTWPWSAGPIIGRSMRGAGGWPAAPTVG
jgi:hypothetical protein